MNYRVARAGTPFARTFLGGAIVSFLLFLNNAIFREAGDAAIAVRIDFFTVRMTLPEAQA